MLANGTDRTLLLCRTFCWVCRSWARCVSVTCVALPLAPLQGIARIEQPPSPNPRSAALFLQGDWRGISRHYVVTRTPTQVASHAQKHFIRQQTLSKRKRRASLFDITGEDDDAQLVSVETIVWSRMTSCRLHQLLPWLRKRWQTHLFCNSQDAHGALHPQGGTTAAQPQAQRQQQAQQGQQAQPQQQQFMPPAMQQMPQFGGPMQGQIC